MFENLSEKLQRTFKNLRGQGTISEENIGEALREIRVALLEADVNLNVVKDLIEHIRAKAVGQEVMTALSPTAQVIKIVRDELVTLLGKDTARFQFASKPPTVILMAGLQGSGKTTTSGKLAAWLQKGGHRPMLVSVDVYRPAARGRDLGLRYADCRYGWASAHRRRSDGRDGVAQEAALSAGDPLCRRLDDWAGCCSFRRRVP